MKEIAMVLFFTGVILIMHGIYSQKFQALLKNPKKEYQFIPRSYYDEQFPQTSNYDTLFDRDYWIDRNVTLSNPSLERINMGQKS